MAFLSDYQFRVLEQLLISLRQGTDCWYLKCLIDCRDFNGSKNIKIELIHSINSSVLMEKSLPVAFYIVSTAQFIECLHLNLAIKIVE